jgi:hypothetical protein
VPIRVVRRGTVLFRTTTLRYFMHKSILVSRRSCSEAGRRSAGRSETDAGRRGVTDLRVRRTAYAEIASRRFRGKPAAKTGEWPMLKPSTGHNLEVEGGVGKMDAIWIFIAATAIACLAIVLRLRRHG